ncbi:MAG TPA: DUF4292 domain-containing protein [Chitinophagaceae bacterium]|nr:DUF4292 domain-containing protein [Chitinophagaceae bacterium]
MTRPLPPGKTIRTRMVLRNFLLSSLALSGLLPGCGPSSRIARSTTPTAQAPDSLQAPVPGDSAVTEASALAQVLSGVRSHIIPFQSFSAKLKVDYSDSRGDQTAITAFVHLQKDSAIWISITPLLGIEMARVLITPDSVMIMNKINKTIKTRGTDLIRQILNIPADFSTLQDILIGNPIFLNGEVKDYSRSPSLISFTCLDSSLQSHYIVFSDDYRIQDFRLSDRDTASGRYCDITFGDYAEVDGRNFSTRRRIFAEDTSVTQINLSFSRVRFDQPLSFSFYIPSDYRRK